MYRWRVHIGASWRMRVIGLPFQVDEFTARRPVTRAITSVDLGGLSTIMFSYIGLVFVQHSSSESRLQHMGSTTTAVVCSCLYRIYLCTRFKLSGRWGFPQLFSWLPSLPLVLHHGGWRWLFQFLLYMNITLNKFQETLSGASRIQNKFRTRGAYFASWWLIDLCGGGDAVCRYHYCSKHYSFTYYRPL